MQKINDETIAFIITMGIFLVFLAAGGIYRIIEYAQQWEIRSLDSNDEKDDEEASTTTSTRQSSANESRF